jgi:parallel beta-helix repeat protein
MSLGQPAVTVDNNQFFNASISQFGGSSWITNNTFENPGKELNSAMSVSDSSNDQAAFAQIAGNILLGYFRAIMLGSGSDVSITNNIIQDPNTGIMLTYDAKATIENNKIVGYAGSGIELRMTAQAILYKNTFEGLETRSARGVSLSDDTIATIQDNNIIENDSGIIVDDNAAAAILDNMILNNECGVRSGSTNENLKVRGNIIIENNTGISTDGKISIENNTIRENSFGIDIGGQEPVAVIQENCIEGNIYFGLDAYGSLTEINAKNNWWGDKTGPAHENNPGGMGDDIYGSKVIYDPWLIAANCWSPSSMLKLSCESPLKEYKDNGTDCVYRRGLGNAFDVVLLFNNGENPEVLITDPKQTEGKSRANVSAPVITNNMARFKVEIPDSNPVGIYEVKGTVNVDDITFSSEKLHVYVIFGLPASLSKSDKKAYLYDETLARDQLSYMFSIRDGWIKKDRIMHQKTWPEQTYVLNQYDKNFFDKIISAIAGEDSVEEVAKNLTYMVSNLIIYSDPNYRNDVPRMLSSVTREQFRQAYAYEGVEKPLVRGQCLDYANFLAAAMRSVGIPARVATKIEAVGFSYHQWTEGYLEKIVNSDHWFLYDAMDYTASHMMKDDLVAEPAAIGQPRKNIIDGANYTKTAFEIVVGAPDWRVDEGKLNLNFTDMNKTRIGIEAMSGTNIKDALFEKCKNKNYSYENCPDIDPPTSLSLIDVSLDKADYRVGDVLKANVTIRNPEAMDKNYKISFRFFKSHRLDDGRTAGGDEVQSVAGTGILGTNIFEATESISIPGNHTIKKEFVTPITDVAFQRDQYAISVTAIESDTIADIQNVDVIVKPAYDVEIIKPSPPNIGELFALNVRVTNSVAFPITKLHLGMEVPALLSSSDPFTHHVEFLDSGSDVFFTWNFESLWKNIPSLQNFRVIVTSANGGNYQEAFSIEIMKPPMPIIRSLDRASDLLTGETFQLIYEVENIGSLTLMAANATLSLPDELVAIEPLTQGITELLGGESVKISWNVHSNRAGAYVATLTVQDEELEQPEVHTQLIEIIDIKYFGDSDGDGDVDGVDLYKYLEKGYFLDLSEFCSEFGSASQFIKIGMSKD